MSSSSNTSNASTTTTPPPSPVLDVWPQINSWDVPAGEIPELQLSSNLGPMLAHDRFFDTFANSGSPALPVEMACFVSFTGDLFKEIAGHADGILETVNMVSGGLLA